MDAVKFGLLTRARHSLWQDLAPDAATPDATIDSSNTTCSSSTKVGVRSSLDQQVRCQYGFASCEKEKCGVGAGWSGSQLGHQAYVSPYRDVERQTLGFTMDNANTHRCQLRERLLHGWYPHANNEIDSLFSPLISRELLDLPGATVKYALDSLCLLHLGMALSSPHLVAHGLSKYHVTARGIRQRIQYGTAALEESSLAAAYLLGFCELYGVVAKSRRSSERSHFKLVERLLVQRGPHRDSSTFLQMLVYAIRQIAGVWATGERGASPLGGNEWHAQAASTSPLMEAFQQFRFRIGTVLQDIDRRALTEEEEVRTRLSTLDSEMKSWLLYWYASFSSMPYRQVATSQFTHFDSLPSKTSDVYPTSFEYPSFAIASGQTTYWTVQLQIKKALILSYLRQPCRNEIEAEQTRMAVAEGREIVDNLCQSVAWLTRPQNGLCGSLRAVGLLACTGGWFLVRDDRARFEWCSKIRAKLESRGMAPLYTSGIDLLEEDRGVTSQQEYIDNEEVAMFDSSL